MRLALDVDGVLADIMTPWIRLYNERYGKRLRREEVKQWGFWRVVGISEKEFFELFTLAWKKWREVPPTEPELGKKVERLRSISTVDIVTGRSKETMPYVSLWLKWQAIDYDGLVLVVAGTDKADLEYDYFVDDSPVNAQLLAEKGKKVLLYDQPWNRGVPEGAYIRRVKSLDEVYSSISSPPHLF